MKYYNKNHAFIAYNDINIFANGSGCLATIGNQKTSIEKRLGKPPEVAAGDTIASGELTQGSGFRRFPTWLYINKGVIINFDDQSNRVISVKCKNNF